MEGGEGGELGLAWKSITHIHYETICSSYDIKKTGECLAVNTNASRYSKKLSVGQIRYDKMSSIIIMDIMCQSDVSWCDYITMTSAYILLKYCDLF